MRTCLIDLRCLQDPAYRDRGIGRHARVLLAHARAGLPRTRLVGIADPQMPALSGADRAMVDAFRTTSYTGAMTEPCCFVQLSPMTHDPLFVGRLLHHPAIPAASVVYDFIPLEDPACYLACPAQRLAYHAALRWLARHDLFMPISQDAASGLTARLGIGRERITVTGAPLAPAFQDLPVGSERHLLVVAGNHPRKDPECAIRAHARSSAMQASRTPLVVTGDYGAEWRAEQCAAIVRLGGDPMLLETPGHVDERTLLGLYANARCVVAPSRAEGFSLPVIEAMAAGKPVLASDIPAHRELLDDGLFAPGDDATLAALLDQVAEPAWCAAALARQATVWPRFQASAVAERFWAEVDRLRPTTAPAAPPARPKVALLTPLPPDQSGVADYSAAACLELGKAVELHVFAPTADPVIPAGASSVSPLTAFPFLSSRFDRVVAVLGNSVFHLEILRLLLRYGGAVVMHDGRMLDLYAGHLGFDNTVAMAEKELRRPLRHNEIWAWLAGDIPTEALILSEVASAAEPLMMHSRAAIADVARLYAKQAIHLPFAVYRSFDEARLTPVARHAARQRLGISESTTLLVSIGYVHPTKAPIDCIWALVLLRSWGIEACLHFVGASLMPTDALERLVAEHGLEAHVRIPDAFVAEDTYRDYLVGADVAVQLRHSAAGSVSGTLSDCIAAGLPTVASAALADAIDAAGFVHTVPNHPSPVLIAEAVLTVLQRGDTAVGWRDYVAGHGFNVYTQHLCRALGLGLAPGPA
jgi:glycosyltransferase involved in cell wall biosynthesis